MEDARQSENGNTANLMKYSVSTEKYSILTFREQQQILTILPEPTFLAQIQTQMYITYLVLGVFI